MYYAVAGVLFSLRVTNKSLIKKLKRLGDRIVPYGTPFVETYV